MVVVHILFFPLRRKINKETNTQTTRRKINKETTRKQTNWKENKHAPILRPSFKYFEKLDWLATENQVGINTQYFFRASEGF